MQNFDFLDSFRGLSAIVVIVGHLFLFGLKVNLFEGTSGVMMFFQLSAFLLTYRLIAQYDEAGQNVRKIAQVTINYFIMRFFRIYVIFCLFCAIYTVCMSQVFNENATLYMWDAVKLNRRQIAKDSYRYAHLWTISVEIYYYMFIPPIAFVMSRLKSLWQTLFMVVFAIGFIVWLNSPSVVSVGYNLNTPASFHFPVFFYGSLNAFFYTAANRHGLVGFVRRHRALNFIVCFLACALLYFSLRIRASYQVYMRRHPGTLALQFMIMMLGSPNALTDALVKIPLLKEYGKYSYGAYLFHMFGMRLVLERVNPRISILNQIEDMTMYIILASLAFGVVFYYAIEMPMIRIAHFCIRKVKPLVTLPELHSK